MPGNQPEVYNFILNCKDVEPFGIYICTYVFIGRMFGTTLKSTPEGSWKGIQYITATGMGRPVLLQQSKKNAGKHTASIAW